MPICWAKAPSGGCSGRNAAGFCRCWTPLAERSLFFTSADAPPLLQLCCRNWATGSTSWVQNRLLLTRSAGTGGAVLSGYQTGAYRHSVRSFCTEKTVAPASRCRRPFADAHREPGKAAADLFWRLAHGEPGHLHSISGRRRFSGARRRAFPPCTAMGRCARPMPSATYKAAPPKITGGGGAAACWIWRWLRRLPGGGAAGTFAVLRQLPPTACGTAVCCGWMTVWKGWTG